MGLNLGTISNDVSGAFDTLTGGSYTPDTSGSSNDTTAPASGSSNSGSSGLISLAQSLAGDFVSYTQAKNGIVSPGATALNSSVISSSNTGTIILLGLGAVAVFFLIRAMRKK